MFKKSASRNLFTALFAFLTVGIMALFFSIYEPWQPIGPELIPDGSFSTPEATNGWNGWSQQAQLVPDGGYGESPGVVLTTSSNEHGLLRFTVNDLTNIPAFRVSLRATAQGIVQGKENYHLPRALFFYRDANSKGLFNLHHGILAITKDTGWRYYKDFFPVPENAINAQMYIQNLGVAGVMHADDVSVIPVRARPSAPWWKLFFGTLWTAAFGFCLSALRPWTRRYGFMIMATLVLILTGITLPGKFLDESIEKTARAARDFIPKPVAPAPPVQIAKAAPEPPTATPLKPKEEPAPSAPISVAENAHIIGHLILFSLLALLSALSWISSPSAFKRVAAVFSGLTFFAAATEVLQFIPPDRSAGLSDLSIDVFGMAGAVVLVLLLRGIQRRINRD